MIIIMTIAFLGGNPIIPAYAQTFDITGLEVYWQFEETSGILTTEDFANIDDADSILEVGIIKTNTGVIGNAWKFGSNSVEEEVVSDTRIKIGGTASDWDFLNVNDVTVNFWTLDESAPDPSILFTTESPIDTASGTNMFYILETGTTSYRQDQVGIGTGVFQFSPEFFIVTNEEEEEEPIFHMYTVTLNLATDELKWYRDGRFLETDEQVESGQEFSTSDITPILGNAETIGEGETMQYLNPMSDVTIDEWSIWSRVLTDQEVSDLYNSGNGLALESSTAVPDQVTVFTATATSTTTIFLDWDTPGGSEITGYQIQRVPPFAGGFITIGTDTNFVDTGLIPATLYTYKVSAINAEGTGPESAETTATTFTPQEATDDLSDAIQELIDDETLTGGQGGALISKLDNIIEKLNNGQTNASCNQLGAFINQINAYIINGTLTEEEGQAQILATQAIKDAAGC